MSKRILMAEDSRSVRALMSQALKAAGYEVIEADDGVEALERVKDGGFDMLITDLNMPRLDGLSLIREVRRTSGNRFLPIIMLTSETDEGSRQEGRAAGASAWIAKPFRPEQLLSVVRTVIP